MNKNELTQVQLKELLDYEPTTGEFRWKPRPGSSSNRKAGDVAGCNMKDGYRMIRIFKNGYLAHRLAYLYMTGSFPAELLDHINGVRSDNRWSNLRDVSTRENFQNKKCHRGGNLPGASYCPYLNKNKPWLAQIQINKKKKSLGLYPTEQLAHEAYIKACAEIEQND